MGVTFGPTIGEGEGVVGTRDLREVRHHNKHSQAKLSLKAATITTGAGASADIAHGHTFAQDVARYIPGQLAQTSRKKVKIETTMTVDDTSLYGSVPLKVQIQNKHVETELLNIPLVQSNLGSAPSLQQRVGSTPALSGRRAPQAGDTQPVGHALQQRPPGPVHSGKRSQSAPLTQPRTTTPHSPEHKLANSPINIINLRKELDKYEKINRVHADELRYGFSDGFKLGYMGPRE